MLNIIDHNTIKSPFPYLWFCHHWFKWIQWILFYACKLISTFKNTFVWRLHKRGPRGRKATKRLKRCCFAGKWDFYFYRDVVCLWYYLQWMLASGTLSSCMSSCCSRFNMFFKWIVLCKPRCCIGGGWRSLWWVARERIIRWCHADWDKECVVVDAGIDDGLGTWRSVVVLVLVAMAVVAFVFCILLTWWWWCCFPPLPASCCPLLAEKYLTTLSNIIAWRRTPAPSATRRSNVKKGLGKKWKE